MKTPIAIVSAICLIAAHAHADHTYKVVKLVADQPGIARHTDPYLINPWGLTIRPNGNIMIADNGTDLATTYRATGKVRPTRVAIPGAPTGLVQNFGPDFVFSNGAGSAPARVIYAVEDGRIAAWNPDLDPTNAIVVVDNSASGAVYKGIARGQIGAEEFLYVANFHDGVVEVYDSHFDFVLSFTDATIPAGFAPFNVRNIRGRLFVTYAKQLAPDNEDDEAGPGNGFVDVFDLDGTFLHRFASRGVLNSPWDVTRAPFGFGIFSDAVLVGNFGDGRINAFNPDNGNFLGPLRKDNGDPIAIDGLWGLTFGVRTALFLDPFGCFCDEAFINIPVLYFTAGPDDEAHGLFGFIRPRFFFLP